MTIPTIEGRRFSVGKYDIVAKPIPQSAHMLRYTVFVSGKRIGSMASEPNESDCRFMGEPSRHAAPGALHIYVPAGPAQEGAPPRTVEALTPPREELPDGMAFPGRTEER